MHAYASCILVGLRLDFLFILNIHLGFNAMTTEVNRF